MSFDPSTERVPADTAVKRKRHATDPRPPRMRSAVTNGARLFVEGSGTSAWSRRYRDLIAGHIGDMAGPDMISEAQLSLIKRASAIECELVAYRKVSRSIWIPMAVVLLIFAEF